MRQLLLLCISFCVCIHMYVCMSITLRNANFLYLTCLQFLSLMAHEATLLLLEAGHVKLHEHENDMTMRNIYNSLGARP